MESLNSKSKAMRDDSVRDLEPSQLVQVTGGTYTISGFGPSSEKVVLIPPPPPLVTRSSPSGAI
jgi:hypothetical protein